MSSQIWNDFTFMYETSAAPFPSWYMLVIEIDNVYLVTAFEKVLNVLTHEEEQMKKTVFIKIRKIIQKMISSNQDSQY